ncbi:cytochrome P450 CYP12A2 [Stomoxys calcitrans]|uniref:cytochrome P450 CYP12A2 n=1 Tax=Stomoxys calcitrans TaxID=35570 RepID=UPI0027E2EDDE|nr:cytochrome P450 CYP12A2 [Stomoxys calcitrans]
MKYYNCLTKSILYRNNSKQLRFQSTLNHDSIPSNTISSDNANHAKAFEEKWNNAKPYEEIPTIKLLKFLRGFLPGGKYSKLDGVQMVMDVKDECGNISKIPGLFGRDDAVMSHNPDDFEILFRNEGIWPVRPGSDGLAYHRSVHRADFFKGVEGILATKGEKWGSFRSMVNPVLLQPKNVRLYLNKLSQVNKEFVTRIKDIRDPHTLEVPKTFETEINRWALESISIVALNKKFGLLTKNHEDPEVAQLFAWLTDFFTYSVDVEFKPPIWKFVKTRSFKRLMAALDGITDLTSKYVNEAIEGLEEERRNGVPEKPESEQSVLEKLAKKDKKVAAVMAMDMLMAGVDTTTSSITAWLLCLALNPEKQSILREEVLKVLPHKDSEFDEAAFKNMPYLRASLKEALRVYPLFIGTARLIANDVVLSGYRIPKGTQVSIVYESLFSDDAHYRRAKEYLPERWLRSTEAVTEAGECPQDLRSSNPFIYFPFGFGARSCVGRRIAELEMEVAVARLIRNFYIEFNHPTDKPFKSLFLRVPNIPLTFKFIDVEK